MKSDLDFREIYSEFQKDNRNVEILRLARDTKVFCHNNWHQEFVLYIFRMHIYVLIQKTLIAKGKKPLKY